MAEEDELATQLATQTPAPTAVAPRSCGSRSVGTARSCAIVIPSDCNVLTLPRLGSRVRIPSSAPRGLTAGQTGYLTRRAASGWGRNEPASPRKVRGISRSCLEGGVERVRHRYLRLWEQVPVAVARDADARVAEVVLDLLHVPSARDEERTAGVTEIVPAKVTGELVAPRDGGQEVSASEVAMMHRASLGGSEQPF